MPFSLTYIAVGVLAWLGVDNAQEVADATIIIGVALIALFGRWRAGGINLWGKRE